MWTVCDPPDASVPVHVSSPLEITQPSGPDVPAASIAQFTPTGSVSSIRAPLAAPGPELDATIVKPICVPALTAAASSVLVMCRLGQRTASDALAFGDVSTFAAWTSA